MNSSLPLGAAFLWEPSGTHEIVTPERFTEEQRAIARAGREFSENEIDPLLRDIEAKKPGLMPALLKKAGEVGLLMVDVPAEYGGLGLGKTTSMLLAEQFSHVGSFSVSLGAHTGIGTMPIVYFGTAEQKKRYLADLATGTKIAAYALTEPSSGSDALAAQTRAVLSPDKKHYILNGTKQFITNAGFADLFTTFAKVDGEKFTAFLVPRDAPGLTVGPEEHKMGIRGSSTCSLAFEDCKIPVENLLGEIGKGHKIAFNILNIGRVKLGVGTIGASKYALELATRYAKERKQFGKPIASFGLVAEKLAEMAIRVFVGETMGYRTTGLLDARLESATGDVEKVAAIEEYSVESSIIKVFGSEALSFCADETVQVHGGYGFIEDFAPERMFRDSRINRIFEGTNEINRLIVPGTILKRALKGELPLITHAATFRQRLAAGDLPRRGEGPLADEQQVVQLSQWATVYALSVVAETYHMTVADQQEILGSLADMIGRVYALDSVVTRVQQAQASSDTALKTLFDWFLAAYVPRAYSAVRKTARQILRDVCDPQSLPTHLAAMERLRLDWPQKVIEAKRQLAASVIEAGGYPLDR